VDFVLTAGSMAMGNVRPESDFDVIVGARSGRIFTARFFGVVAFGLFGWRRKNSSTHQLINSLTADKICLNHFVTPAAYRLSPPHNNYWKRLYENLVPVFGEAEKINRFFKENADWTNKTNGTYKTYVDDLRHEHKTSSLLKKLLEWILASKTGNWLERQLKRLQIKRIETSLKLTPAYKPRIIFNDNELEFHPDTRRVEILERIL
jgi:hypothetical protein